MPPRIPITRARVLDTALEIVNERGVDGLTMRALATELDIEAPSLYKHIANKDEILDGLCELVYQQVQVTDLGSEWQDRLKTYARAFRKALLDNRNVVFLIASRPVATDSSMILVEATLAEFVRAGVDVETGRRLLNVIVGMVIGHVLTEVNDPVPGQAESDRILQFRRTLDPEAFPLALATLGTRPVDRNAEFELALDVFVSGLESAFAEELAAAVQPSLG